MIQARSILALSILITLHTPLWATDGRTEQLTITQDEFDLELEILSAAAAGDETIRFQRATYLRETTINLSDISNIAIYFGMGSEILLDNSDFDIVNIHNCQGIDISGGHFSHVKPLDDLDCRGSVFVLRNSRYIEIYDCLVMGCGSIGFKIMDCSFLRITYCKIKENSTCAFYLSGVEGLYIADCEIIDNGELFTPAGSIDRLWMIGNTISGNGLPFHP